MIGWDERRLDDFARFARMSIDSGDVDPVYPVIKGLAGTLPANKIAWLDWLHVAYYDLGSAALAYANLPIAMRDGWGSFPGMLTERILRLPTGTERRAHRDPERLRRHLLDTMIRAKPSSTIVGGVLGWLHDAVHLSLTDRRPAYLKLFEAVEAVYGNGRWAAYKTCELLAETLGQFGGAWSQCRPTDMGHAHSTGPRKGLALLRTLPVPQGSGPSAVAELDAMGEELVAFLLGEGVSATVANTETALCDFHSLARGRYYVGHDIDQLAGQLQRVCKLWYTLTDAEAQIIDATWTSFTRRFETWRDGPDPARKTIYARTGEVLPCVSQ
jgi:hypothetical protein